MKQTVLHIIFYTSRIILFPTPYCLYKSTIPIHMFTVCFSQYYSIFYFSGWGPHLVVVVNFVLVQHSGIFAGGDLCRKPHGVGTRDETCLGQPHTSVPPTILSLQPQCNAMYLSNNLGGHSGQRSILVKLLYLFSKTSVQEFLSTCIPRRGNFRHVSAFLTLVLTRPPSRVIACTESI